MMKKVVLIAVSCLVLIIIIAFVVVYITQNHNDTDSTNSTNFSFLEGDTAVPYRVPADEAGAFDHYTGEIIPIEYPDY